MQKHLVRLKRGIYLPISHKGLTPEESFGDPFLVVPAIFLNSSYIGGWSMASYWGLTEQIFQVVVVLTEKDIHISRKSIGRFNYILFKAHLPLSIGLETIWIENQQIIVSDIHRTVIDMLENPRCGGGIQNIIDCTKVYFQEFYDPQIFIKYASQVKNGVFFKRLGFICEKLLNANHPLCELSKQRITKGNSPIDSHLKCEALVTRWNLFINEELDV
jgi:predicted transcriptional regulator of viral defense system